VIIPAPRHPNDACSWPYSLKEEVIAQGIELQRRWVREIKVRVEAERGGRLARLDELAASLKKLESVALDNAAALDDTVRAHALWSALRAVHHAVDAPVRRPFRSELRVLRAAAGARDDAVVQAALGALEAGECADVGVEPLGALSAWFASSVAPRVESVALVPDAGAGVLSHLASHLVASFRFRRSGLVEGGDVLSVLARAEHYLAEKDLDSAAREVNQLTGVAKGLASDWMDAARRRLEVVQALEVSAENETQGAAHTHATSAGAAEPGDSGESARRVEWTILFYRIPDCIYPRYS
jgi:mitofilin